MSTRTRYQVRQTLGYFGTMKPDYFDTLEEAEKCGCGMAKGIAGIHYHRNKETGYADIPYYYQNPKYLQAFKVKLSRLAGAYSDIDGTGRRFYVRGKMKWEDLVELIYQDVIEITEVKAQ
jgi:hypothetical protein